MTDLCCREVSEFLMDYFDKALPADVQEGFTGHVASCENCRTYLAQYKDTIAAGQLACEDEGCPDCPDDLVRAVMAALGKEPKA
jgi:hypothetical protein